MQLKFQGKYLSESLQQFSELRQFISLISTSDFVLNTNHLHSILGIRNKNLSLF